MSQFLLAKAGGILALSGIRFAKNRYLGEDADEPLYKQVINSISFGTGSASVGLAGSATDIADKALSDLSDYGPNQPVIGALMQSPNELGAEEDEFQARHSIALAYARNSKQAYSPQKAHKIKTPKVNKPNKVRGI